MYILSSVEGVWRNSGARDLFVTPRNNNNNDRLEPSWLEVSPPGSHEASRVLWVLWWGISLTPNGFVTRSTNTGNFDFGRAIMYDVHATFIV